MRVDIRGSGGSPGVLDPFGVGRTEFIQDDAEGQGKIFPSQDFKLCMLKPTVQIVTMLWSGPVLKIGVPEKWRCAASRISVR